MAEGHWEEEDEEEKGGGEKPRGAVALADLKSELSVISIGDSQAQGQVRGEEVMEGVVEGDGGDGSKGVAFPGGKEKGAASQPSPASPSVGPAFDAHFHLDRQRGKEKGNLSVDFIYKMSVSPRDKVDLKKKRGGGGGLHGLLSNIGSNIFTERRIEPGDVFLSYLFLGFVVAGIFWVVVFPVCWFWGGSKF